MKRTRRIERAGQLPWVLLASFAFLVPASGHADEEREEFVAPDEPDTLARSPAVTKFPDYPALARRDRIEGETTVCFKIAPDGRVLDAEVTSSTHKVFEKPALEAVRESSFEPLPPGEEVSGSPVCRTFRFRLDPVEPQEAA